MGVSKVTLTVFNPRAEVESVAQAAALSRLDNLAGKKIGVLCNGKPGAEMLLPYIQEALKKRIRDVEFRTWLVPMLERPEVKEPKLKEIAEYSDGVIALTGD